MSLTCISCKVVFALSELQREHYKSDWHRYNLKRKIAELPSVTKEEFDARAAAHNAAPSETDHTTTCDSCHKKFSSEKTLANHVMSKKHLESVERNKSIAGEQIVPEIVEEMVCSDDADSDWESIGEEQDEDDTSIPPDTCLFCCLCSESMEDNVKHMTKVHSFFIPDIEYLVDLKGLLIYLGHKVGNGYMCLWCNTKGKSFYSVKSAQQHMEDRGHCKLLHEGEALLSYGEFYDYRSSHSDTTEENEDEEIELDAIDGEGYELVLPSGAVIGHRSLVRYYRQNLPLKPFESPKAVSSIMQHYRSLGWTGTTGETAVRKAKDLKFWRRLQGKRNLKLGMKQNKFQPHFRSQIQF